MQVSEICTDSTRKQSEFRRATRLNRKNAQSYPTYQIFESFGRNFFFLEKIENFLSPEMPNRVPQHPEAIGIPTWDLFRSNEHQKLSYAPKFQIVWMKTVARARVRVFRASPDSTRTEAVGIMTWDLFKSKDRPKLYYAPKFQIIWMKIVACARVRVKRAIAARTMVGESRACGSGPSTMALHTFC